MTEQIEIPAAIAEILVEQKEYEGYTSIDTEQIDKRRWTSIHQLIVRRDSDDTLWRLFYERPLTEYQDAELFGGDDPVPAHRVVARVITTTEYVDAEDGNG